MFLVATILIILLAFGESHTNGVKESNDQTSKRIVALTAVTPQSAAKSIHYFILQRDSRLQGRQFGFLYLHDGTSNKITFEDGLEATDATTSNFLYDVPDSKPYGKVEKNNNGHAEKKLLENLEAMRTGFNIRHKQCPAFVILGTVHDPCNRENPSGCAQSYVAAKNAFTKYCGTTGFYLFVSGKVEEKYKRFWLMTQKLMQANKIGVLTL